MPTPLERFNNIQSALVAKRRKYDEAAGQLALLEKQRTNKQAELAQAKEDVILWEQAQTLLTITSNFSRAQGIQRIEKTVTAALDMVFPGEDSEFKVAMSAPEKPPAADWLLVSPYGDRKVEGAPEDSDGGGATDVISLGMRLSVIEMSRPKEEAPLLLDEPGKWVDKERVGNLAYFLKQYGAKTGRQMLMVTHIGDMIDAGDKAYKVTKVNGTEESEVREVG